MDGLCECGCGKKTSIAKQTRTEQGIKAGERRRFCLGHYGTRDIRKRFWEKVSKSDGCWEWTGSRPNGYGEIRFNRKMVKAHRLSWMFSFGRIPEGLCILHKCDNPRCVRPSHLFVGTQQDNNTDKKEKGRCNPNRGESVVNSKLTESDVLEIREKLDFGNSENHIAYIYGVSRRTINHIKNRKTWTHI